jgi:hypothetical protein
MRFPAPPGRDTLRTANPSMTDRPPIPESVSGCTVESTLREGPATVVARARDGLGLPVDLHFFHAAAVLERVPKESFFDQVRATAGLHSDRLCAVVNAGEKGAWWFVATKGAEGATLANLFARGHLDEERALGIFAAVADGLAALEGAGMRHGCLEPGTIALPGAGQVILTLRRLVPLDLAGRDARYLSPEEARGEDWGIASDLFSFGLLLFESLHGKPAIEGEADEVTVRLARGVVPKPAALLRGVLPQTVDLVASLLSPDPRLRPPSAAETGRRLRALQAAFSATESLEGTFDAPLAAVPEAVGAASPPAAPAPTAASPAAPPPPSLRSRRAQARLVLPHRGTELIHEILDPVTHIGLSEEGRVVARPEPFPGAVARIESGMTSDFLVSTGVEPIPEVRGEPVQRRELRFGDAIGLGGVEILFEKAEKLLPEGAEGTDQERAHHLRPRASKAPLAMGIVLSLGVAVWGGLRVVAARNSRADEVEGLRRRRIEAESLYAKAPPLPQAPTTLERAAREETALRLLDGAREDLAAGRGRQGREKLDSLVRQYPDTGAALISEEELKAIRGAGSLPGTEELRAAQARAEALAAEGKPSEAREVLLKFAEGHRDSYAGDRAAQGADAFGKIAVDRVDDLLGQARIAEGRKDWQGALESAARAVAAAPPGEAADRARAELARLRSLIPGSVPVDPAPKEPERKPVAGEKPPAPPPPTPDPPKKAVPTKDEEAAALFRSSREALEAGRVGEAERGFYRLLAEYRDSRMVRDYGDEVAQRYVDAMKKGHGVAGLFHGGLQFRGNRAIASYSFENAAELLDWETIATFAVPQKGTFKAAAGEMVAEGAATFMMRAAFKPDSVTMSFRVRPAEPVRDLGAMMAEPKDIANNLLFTINNDFFRLGKGAKAYAIPGNVIFVFGKGMWRDTDPGMVGFVKTAVSEEPKVPPRKWTEVEVAKEKDKARFVIEGKTLTGRAVGDNKYELTGVRPALFVLLSEAAFDDVTVEGELDPEWVRAERARVFPDPK